MMGASLRGIRRGRAALLRRVLLARSPAPARGDDLAGANGVAFSPDEGFLYVTNWDTAKKVVMRYP